MVVDVTPAVRDALAAHGAVVALESTLVCHGLPRPDNLAVAREMEAAVAAAGAVPATVAVLDGRVRIGLQPDQLTRLAQLDDVPKCSARDLPLVIGRGGDGATTVAATIALAARAGIHVMATGGIGGVHRGGETSLDESADLFELARTPVAVVCSGVKIILDLPRTLERLETLGVPVVGYRTGELPAFYGRGSGLMVADVAELDELAAVVRAQRALFPERGMVVAQPPPPAFAIAAPALQRLVDDALSALAAAGLRGPAQTPFLLAHMAKASDGATIAVNRALAVANARLAGELAALLTEIV